MRFFHSFNLFTPSLTALSSTPNSTDGLCAVIDRAYSAFASLFQFHQARHFRYVFVAAAGEVDDDDRIGTHLQLLCLGDRV